MYKQKFVFLILSLFLLGKSYQLYALDYTQGINNPTAQTNPEKSLSLSFMTYNEGGIQNKLIISLFDKLDLGMAWAIHRAIGDQQAEFVAPGPVGKFKITEGSSSFPIFISFGYDAFFTQANLFQKEGQNSSISEIYYGPHITISKPIYLLGFEQFLHFGVKMPVQPDYKPNLSSGFFAYDIPIGKEFILQFEVDQIFLNLENNNKTLFNMGFRYVTGQNLDLAVHLMFSRKRSVNRVLQLEYKLRFD